MKITLRKVIVEDKNYFAKWWRDPKLIALTSGNFDLLSDKEILKSVIDMAKNDLHWMIEADGQTVGHINLEKIDEGKAEIQIVIGEEEYWGKDVAKEAAEQLFILVKNLGFKILYLEVRPTNYRAIGFYKKIGFSELGIKKYHDNQNLPEVVMMEKILDN